jgi:hypothetical protein
VIEKIASGGGCSTIISGVQGMQTPESGERIRGVSIMCEMLGVLGSRGLGERELGRGRTEELIANYLCLIVLCPGFCLYSLLEILQ